MADGSDTPSTARCHCDGSRGRRGGHGASPRGVAEAARESTRARPRAQRMKPTSGHPTRCSRARPAQARAAEPMKARCRSTVQPSARPRRRHGREIERGRVVHRQLRPIGRRKSAEGHATNRRRIEDARATGGAGCAPIAGRWTSDRVRRRRRVRHAGRSGWRRQAPLRRLTSDGARRLDIAAPRSGTRPTVACSEVAAALRGCPLPGRLRLQLGPSSASRPRGRQDLDDAVARPQRARLGLPEAVGLPSR